MTYTGQVSSGTPPYNVSWTFGGGTPGSDTGTISADGGTHDSVAVFYNTAGSYTTTFVTTGQAKDCTAATRSVQVQAGGNNPPIAVNDTANTNIGTPVTINAAANDTDVDGDLDPNSVTVTSQPSNGSALSNGDGTVTYTPSGNFTGTDSFGYSIDDLGHNGPASATVTVTVSGGGTPPPSTEMGDQTDFKILMNYELGMHCTGFEFAYCCVLPVYNSILAQVIKPNQGAPQHGGDYPMLLEGDPADGLDPLARPTVVRDKGELDASGNFKKYVLRYWHEAQPRNDGRGKAQISTLISAVEGNSLMAWNTVADAADVNLDGSLKTGSYGGASEGSMVGNGTLGEAGDNYQNAIWNHLYIYDRGDGVPSVEGEGNTGLEADKIRFGVNGHVVFPPDCGPALHPMGPVTQGGDPSNPPVGNDCGGFANGNVLTFSGEHGTVVYTQMKVLEDLPVTLTSPRIWEALGLPLTPFEDTIDFFADPGLVDEDSVRPFVPMFAALHYYDSADTSVNDGDAIGVGDAVLDSSGNPVMGFGTAPIDIPNCERCHSNAPGTINSPNTDPGVWADVQAEYDYWAAYYNLDTGAGDSDWYARLKSAAISMLETHDIQHGTSFTANYPGTETVGVPAQNTRLGGESVLCHRCHADNVIAVVKSASCAAGNTDCSSPGVLIQPVSEAVHRNHRTQSEGGPIAFNDSLGRTGACQGCHPAHRSDGNMAGYPITKDGGNFYASSDNRLGSGGCFVGRDVHSNPNKDVDGAETPSHLNAMGQWLVDNVAMDQGEWRGIWCTNCHTQLSQEIWKAENMESLVHGVPGPGATNIRALPTLFDVASAIGVSLDQAETWLDPKDPAIDPSLPSGGARLGNTTFDIWKRDLGICKFLTDPTNPVHDATVATIEVALSDQSCSTSASIGPIDCSGDGGPVFDICGTTDADGDFSVNILDFCTTDDCVAVAQGTLAGSTAVAVPFSAATDGRDHWLAAGEPHCADCHAVPYVEQSGHINAFPPFNYPRKASLMRYSRGHQDITCQGCHESIHGLYPVGPSVDTTTYAQAAALNADHTHGPLKCGTCHEVDRNGIPTWMSGVKYNGSRIRSYDDAVSWAHTFTDEVSPIEPDGVCENCHGDRSPNISETGGKWLRHSFVGRIGRQLQDKTEIAALGHVAGGTFVDADDITGLHDSVCEACHSLQGGPSGDFLSLTTCDNAAWKSHNIDGRLAEKVWEYVSVKQNGSTCGW